MVAVTKSLTDAMFIQHGNTLFHTLTNLPPTFGATCLQILEQMVTKKHLILSTDCYQADSIKAQERLRRGNAAGWCWKSGAANKQHPDWPTVTPSIVVDGKTYNLDWNNGEVSSWHKLPGSVGICLCQIQHDCPYIISTWSIPGWSHRGCWSPVKPGRTDSRVIFYLHHAVGLGYKSAVVRTPDTDIFVILLHHAHNIKLAIYLDTGVGKYRQLINVTWLN